MEQPNKAENRSTLQLVVLEGASLDDGGADETYIESH